MAEHRMVAVAQRKSRGHMHPPVSAVMGYIIRAERTETVIDNSKKNEYIYLHRKSLACIFGWRVNW